MARIDDLNQLVAVLNAHVVTLFKQLETVDKAHLETARAMTDLRREHEKQLALLQREIDDLRRWKDDHKKERDEQNRRLWSFGPNIVGAVISGIVAFLVRISWRIGRFFSVRELLSQRGVVECLSTSFSANGSCDLCSALSHRSPSLARHLSARGYSIAPLKTIDGNNLKPKKR